MRLPGREPGEARQQRERVPAADGEQLRRGVPEPVTADLVPTDQARFGGLLTARVGVEEGNSGSGLFDAQLRLAGVVVNRLDARRALAVPAAWIKTNVDLRRQPGRRVPPPSGGHGRGRCLAAPSRAGHHRARGSRRRLRPREVRPLPVPAGNRPAGRGP